MASINEEIMEQISYRENEKKLQFISFNLNKSFIYVIIYWILEITFQILYCNKRELFYMINDEVQNEYMFTIFLNLADLFSGFLVLYIKKTSKSIKEAEIQKGSRDKNDNKNIIDKLISKNDKKTKKNYFTIKLIIIGIFDYLSNSLYWIAFAITDVEDKDFSHLLQKDIVCVFDILMRYIFSIFILKIVLYKHSKVSVLMIVFGFILFLISDILLLIFTPNNESIFKILYYSGILLFKAILLPNEHIMIKKIFMENHILPEKMQFLRAIIITSILTIITPILYFSFRLELNWCFEKKTYFLMIFYIIRSFFKSYFTLKIIYHFSAQSVSFLIISESIGDSINKLIKFINDNNSYIFFVFPEIFGILIILFATLLYDEVIIINKCGLNENVRLGIINRGEEDNKNMKIMSNEDLDFEYD